MNINALETAILDRVRELVRDIRPQRETEELVFITAEDMEAILEIQSIVAEDLLSDWDVHELDN